jgi:DNA-binding transcriptional LysR family regulator
MERDMAGPPLELLIAFAKVAETSSITFAARELGLSKATVSKQINELEARLGVILFARTTRSLTVTEAGKKAYARASNILAEADLIFEEAQDSRTVPRGHLLIAAPHTFSRLWLADALPDFMRDYPDISLEISVDDRKVDLVAEGYDAALRISAMPDSSLIARQLSHMNLFLVAAPAYWAKYGHPQVPQDLAEHACIRYANLPEPSTWRFLGPDGGDVRVKVDGPLMVNGGDMELPALRAGLGIALLPDFTICTDVRAGLLEVSTMAWRAPDVTLHLLTPPGRNKLKRLAVFTQFLVARFGCPSPPWRLSNAPR